MPSTLPTFHADLHIHSKYSRACSKDCDLEHLAWYAKRKGVTLVGTGDFTHPAWNAHLHETLVPAEPGLYRLRDDLARDVDRTLPGIVAASTVRFMLSVEISTIYKRDDKTRKVHHLVYLPDLEAVDRFNTRLARIGNIGSDGRPILGLDSRDLLEITLESSPDGYLVPAHIWTPWFAALGSKSGFDAIADCYADLADHIFAVETGLSSDPAMNWRVSSLDKYTLVSNSDAHSPPALAREAHSYDCALDYYAVREALRTGDGYVGSIEFFPEEGKYHADGHRACGVRWDPAETDAHGGRCATCGKPVTVGVLNRIDSLADRPDGERPEGAAGFRNLVPLPEMVGEINGVGPRSKTVTKEIDGLVAALGPELDILTRVPTDEVAAVGGELIGEAVDRLRRGQVLRESGYDGEYGVIRLFEPDELRRRTSGAALFELPGMPEVPKQRAKVRPAPATAQDVTGQADSPAAAGSAEPETSGVDPVLPLEIPDRGVLEGLDPDQRAAAGAPDGPLLVVAGPGTGKTRTLTHRVAYLVTERAVPADRCLAITFTRRAAGELGERLADLLPDGAGSPFVATFHALGLAICREQAARLGFEDAPRVADEADVAAALVALEANPEKPVPDELRDRFAAELRGRGLLQLDDLVPLAADLLDDDELAEIYRARWQHVLVDEYQDVDADQYRLLRALVPAGGSLFAIGDPDQSIYSFRGADVGFFLRFADDYPTATTVTLSRNYRSAPPIVATAIQVIRPATLVPGRAFSAERRDLGAARIGVHRAGTESEEAGWVAATIDALVGGSSFHSLDSGRVDATAETEEHYGFNDIAVLYRTDAQSKAILSAFTTSGLPYQKRGHDRLADRPGVAAILRELPMQAAGPLVGRVRAAAHTVAERAAAPDLFEAASGLAEPRTAEVWSAVDLLRPVAVEHGEDLDAFLAAVATGAEVDALDPRADAVNLLTLHAAKGLEYPVVFIVGCADGLVPMRWSAPDVEQEAEERRLFFVGLTRARRRLFLSAARQVSRRGAPAESALTPFLAPVDEGLLDRTGSETPRRPRARQMRLI